MDVAVVEEPPMKIYKARKSIPYSNRKQLETLHSLSSPSAPLSPVNREHSDAGCLEAEQPINGQGQGESTSPSSSSRPVSAPITETADSFNSSDSPPEPPCVWFKDVRKEKREDDDKSKQRVNDAAPTDSETRWDEPDAKENAAVPVSPPLLIENVEGKGIDRGGHVHAADQGSDSGLDCVPLPNPIPLSRCVSLSASSPSLSPSHTAESDQDPGAGFLVLSEDEDGPLLIVEEEGEVKEEQSESENEESCGKAEGKHEKSKGDERTSDKSERSIEEHSYLSRPPSERHVRSRDEKMHKPEKIPWKRPRTEEDHELSKTELSFKRPRFEALGLKEVARLANGQTVTSTIKSEDKKATAVNAESDARDLKALKTTLVEKLKMEFEKRNLMKKRAPPADGERESWKKGNAVKLLKDEGERQWSPEERLNMETVEKKPAVDAERNRTDKMLALQKVVQKLVGVELEVQLTVVDCGLQELRDKLHDMEYEGFTTTLNILQGKIAKLSRKALNASYPLDACAGLKKVPVPLTKVPHLPTRSETAAPAPAMPAIPTSTPAPPTPARATPTTPARIPAPPTPALAPANPTTPILAPPAPAPATPTNPVLAAPAPAIASASAAPFTTISITNTPAPGTATPAPGTATPAPGTATYVPGTATPATATPVTIISVPTTRTPVATTCAPILAIVTPGATTSVTTSSVSSATIARNQEASAKSSAEPQRRASLPTGLSFQSIPSSSSSAVPRPVPCPLFSAPALLTTCPSSSTQTIPVNTLLPAAQSQILRNNLLPPSILVQLPGVGPATMTNLPGSQLFPLWLTGLDALSGTTAQPTTTTTNYLLQKSFSSLPTLLTIASSAATPSQRPPSPSTSSPTATSNLQRIPPWSEATVPPMLPATIQTTKEPSSGRDVHSTGVSPSEAVMSSSMGTRAPVTVSGFVTTPAAHPETSSKPKQLTVEEQAGSMSALTPPLGTGILTVQTPVVSGCAMPAPKNLSKMCETAEQLYSTKSETALQASGPVIDLTEEEEEDVQFVAVMQKASEIQSTGTSTMANLQTMVNSMETPTTTTTTSSDSSSNSTHTAVSTRAEVGPPNQVRPRSLQSLPSKSAATTPETPPPPPTSTSSQTATPPQMTAGSTSSPYSPCPYALPPTPEFLLPPGATRTCPPQRPLLKLARDQLHDGLVLSWSVDRANESVASLDCYQLYACHHNSSLSGSQGAPGPWAGWKKIGEVAAKPLPMACTLSHFVPGTRYYYAVRARDVHGRYGSFSEPRCSDDAVAVGAGERLGGSDST